MTADEICRKAALRSRLADAMARDSGEDPAALLEPQRLNDLDEAEWVIGLVQDAGYTLLDERAPAGPSPASKLTSGGDAGNEPVKAGSATGNGCVPMRTLGP